MSNDLSRCVACGRRVAVGILHDPLGPYVHYCADHAPDCDLPINNQVDDLDEVWHD